nr:immunoglobulin heavy chain junction region [Macaca mulatta]MOV47702.1 immunoglobulin heavy chain junction region [Macaca mulatta]MOV47712.1 immunoglobulin heavy chain junction region [Macaca mulatta]MOV47760.1 immunoglobulin heavy chain junction region [Macaca mulatta]MOV47784.1 immunoglobulin heavy chain junction region [Macaca mulatta]
CARKTWGRSLDVW